MRILMTTDTIGGVWTLTRELTQQLLTEGHAIALVSFGRAPTAMQERWCRHIAAQYGEHFLFRASDTPLEWMQNNDTAFRGGADLLARSAHEFHAELLHAHQFCWGALPGRLPRLITAHSDVMSWSTCCRPRGLQASSWLTRYLDLVQRGLNGADAVVAPTAWMREALISHFRVPCKFPVVPNGRAVPPTRSTEKRLLQAVSVGRLWDEAKGIQMLLKIESPLPILVAGEEKFEAASTSTGTLQAVGFLEECELLDLFRRSSIYIATSIYEPFGLAPLEAALCGCAVVARNLPSLREVWASAALFYDTPEELAGLMHELAHDREMLRLAQTRARARAEEFSAARMTKEYLALYRSLLMPEDSTAVLAQELIAYVS